MRQQINLYQPVASEARKPFANATIGVAAGAVVISLIAMWIYGSRQVAGLERAVATMREQTQMQEQALNATGAGQTNRMSPAQAQARVKTLSAKLAAHTHALELLRTGAAGEKTGFAARMEALARRHTHGLWLDRVVLSGTTGAMSVGGATLNADLVPRYLRALSSESALTGTRFDEFMIERPLLKSEDGGVDESGRAIRLQPVDRNSIRFRAESISLRAAAAEKPS
jgi:hypothetical protein